MINEFKIERGEVAYFMRRLHDRYLTTASGGNISYKINDEVIIITPSQMDKANLTADDIAVVGVDLVNYTPEKKVSMEYKMHIEIYKSRPDIKAIVHAHPPYATAFAAAGDDINISLCGEAVAICGIPVRTEYKTMGTEELARVNADAARDANTILMNNHGIITLGKTIFQAYDRIEVLENAAKMSIFTKIIGSQTTIPKEDIEFLDDFSKKN